MTQSRMPDITCIITSVIAFTERPLSYSRRRSIYTASERATQTKQTVTSLRLHLPDAHIILVEGGRQQEIPEQLATDVDDYLYVGNRPLVRWACDGPFKGLAEVLMLLTAMPHLPTSQRYFKLSGRYALNSHFDLHSWPKNGFAFRYYGTRVSTRLYMCSVDCMPAWRRALLRSIPGLLLNYSLEELVPKFVRVDSTAPLAVLGIEGQIGPDGSAIRE